MKKNDTKKGFTLIELIAVIAILGILAVIIVPNIVGYTKKAKDSNVKSDAKVIVNAVNAYNSDQDNPIKDDTSVGTMKLNSDLVGGTDAPIKKWPKTFNNESLKLSDIRNIADNNADYTMESGTVNSVTAKSN